MGNLLPVAATSGHAFSQARRDSLLVAMACTSRSPTIVNGLPDATRVVFDNEGWLRRLA
jgi:hypothetical protein